MRIIFKLIVVLIVLAVVAVGAIFVLPADKIGDLASSQLERATGRKLTLSGEFKPTLFPSLGVKTGPLTISNAYWATSPNIIEAEGAQVKVGLSALWGGDVVIESLRLVNPVVHLEKAADGRGNWELSGSASDASTESSSSTTSVSMNMAEIVDGQIIYLDNATGDVVDLEGLNITIGGLGQSGADHILGSILYNGTPVDVAAQIASFDNIAADKPVVISVTADVAKTSAITFDGTLDLAGSALNGDLTLNSDNLNSLLKAMGVAPVDFPKGVPNGAAVTAKLSSNLGDKISLKDTTATIAGNTMQGNIDVTLGDKPFVRANLRADALDVSKFTSEDGTSSGSNSGAVGWSKDPIRLSGLDGWDGDFQLQANSVNIGVAQLSKTNVSGQLRNGKLTLNLKEVRVFDGLLTGEVRLEGGRKFWITSNVSAKSMQLRPLLGNLTGITRITGVGNSVLSLRSSGSSLHGVMTSLSGKGSIELKNGAFEGIDLASMMRNLKSAFGGFDGATEFTTLGGTFTMENGVLTNSDMSLVSPLFKAAGIGKVDVGQQSMSYTVSPTFLGTGKEISVPVIITGPWNNLSFRPDLEGLLKAAAEAKFDKEELEKKAKAKLQQKLSEKLGVDASDLTKPSDPSASFEDNLKSKAEDKLKKELNSLFKGLSGD